MIANHRRALNKKAQTNFGSALFALGRERRESTARMDNSIVLAQAYYRELLPDHHCASG